MRPSAALLIALLFTATTQLVAQPPKTDPKVEAKVDQKGDDPIAAQLLKDKEVYAAALEKARDGMLKAFDKRYESVKNNKSLKIETQLAQLEKLEAEKKAFDESGVPPTDTGMKVALSEYRTAQKRAEAACKAAFDKAAKAYRDKGDLKLASAMLDEMKEFLAKVPTAGGGGLGAAVVVWCGNTNKLLGLQNGSTDDGTKIVTADYVKGDQSQFWKVVPAGDDWVYIENVKSGLVMTANGKNNCTEVVIAKKQSPASEFQLWKLSPVPNVKDAVKVVPKGSGKPIGVDAKSRNAGSRLLLWTDSDENHRFFGFLPPK